MWFHASLFAPSSNMVAVTTIIITLDDCFDDFNVMGIGDTFDSNYRIRMSPVWEIKMRASSFRKAIHIWAIPYWYKLELEVQLCQVHLVPFTSISFTAFFLSIAEASIQQWKIDQIVLNPSPDMPTRKGVNYPPPCDLSLSMLPPVSSAAVPNHSLHEKGNNGEYIPLRLPASFRSWCDSP
jgi:hypothetical protein